VTDEGETHHVRRGRLLASWIVLCVFAEELAECCLRRTVLKTVHRVSAADRVGAADALGDATELNRYVLGYEVALQRRALLKGNHRVSPSADALEEAIGLDVVSLTREERRLVTLERITRFCLTLVWSASLFIAFYFICDAPGIKDEKGKPLDHGKSKPIWRAAPTRSKARRLAHTAVSVARLHRRYDALFISPLLVTVLGMWIMFRCIGIDYTDNNEGDVKRAMRRFGLGNVLAIISVLCQVLNEKFCSDNEFWKRFPGHAIWHVGMAYGLFQCLIILVVLHANNVRAKTVWYADLPVVKASRWKRWCVLSISNSCAVIPVSIIRDQPQPL